MFRKSKNSDKDKANETSAAESSNAVGTALDKEFFDLRKNGADAKGVAFFAKLYQTKELNPYWQKLHAIEVKTHSEENLDFFVAYLKLLSEPTREQWQRFSARWIEAKNLRADQSEINVISETRNLLKQLSLKMSERHDERINFDSIKMIQVPIKADTRGLWSSGSESASSKEGSSSSPKAKPLQVEVTGKAVLDKAVNEVLKLYYTDKALVISQVLCEPLKESKSDKKSLKEKGKTKSKEKEKEEKRPFGRF